METSNSKQDCIGARVPHEVYETLCRAAELTGATINQFLVQAALKEAHEEMPDRVYGYYALTRRAQG